MKDKNQNIIKVNDQLTNGKETGRITNIGGVTMLVIKYEHGEPKKRIEFSKLNLDEWEVVR